MLKNTELANVDHTKVADIENTKLANAGMTKLETADEMVFLSVHMTLLTPPPPVET